MVRYNTANVVPLSLYYFWCYASSYYLLIFSISDKGIALNSGYLANNIVGIRGI